MKCINKIVALFALSLSSASYSQSTSENILYPYKNDLVSNPVYGIDRDYRDSAAPAASRNGRFVVFVSNADDLLPGGGNNGQLDIYLKDRTTEKITLISASPSGEKSNGPSLQPTITPNGRYIVYTSRASNLVTGDTNNHSDVFVFDRVTNKNQRVSVSSSGNQGNNTSGSKDFNYNERVKHAISDDGRYVIYTSEASNLVGNDTNGTQDVFLRDRIAGTTRRVNVSSAGNQANDYTYSGGISGNGKFAVFVSRASNLTSDTLSYGDHLFIHNISNGTTQRINKSSDGDITVYGFDYTAISYTGRYIAFRTPYVVILDRNKKSVKNTGMGSLRSRDGVSISADGRYIASGMEVYDRLFGISQRVNYIHRNNRSFFSTTLDDASSPLISPDGNYMLFDTQDAYSDEEITGIFDNDAYLINITPFKSISNLTVKLTPSNAATNVSQYTMYSAEFTNTGNQTYRNCTAQSVHLEEITYDWYKRKINYYTWPRSVDIKPGESKRMILALQPRIPLNEEYEFIYACDKVMPAMIPFVNTAFLVSKAGSLNAEDSIQLTNSNARSELEINRDDGKYWTPYSIKVTNPGPMQAKINLSAESSQIFQFLPLLPKIRLCTIGLNRRCVTSGSDMQVILAAGETKKLLVYAHAEQGIAKNLTYNQIIVQAKDSNNKVITKSSIAVYTK